MLCSVGSLASHPRTFLKCQIFMMIPIYGFSHLAAHGLHICSRQEFLYDLMKQSTDRSNAQNQQEKEKDS